MDEIAATAAAGGSEIDKTASLEVVLFSEVGTLKGQRNPVKAEACRSAEHQALEEKGILDREGRLERKGFTYRSIDGLIPVEVCILLQTVMGLSKRHTGKTPCDETGIDRTEAAKESTMPWLRGLWGL